MARESDGRSQEIKEATAQYVFNRWRSGLPGLLVGLPLVFVGVLSILISPRHDWFRHLSSPWQAALLAAYLALVAWLFAWFWRLRSRAGAGLRQLLEWQQRDAGVVVQKVTFRRVGWWFWPFAFGVAPAYVLGLMLLSFRSPVRFQPLVFAVGITALGLGVSRMMAREARAAWRPVHFVWWALYCCYALAAAMGMPQPLGHVTESWAWWVRVMGPILLLVPVDIALREAHGRRQLRRLQALLGEGQEGTGHGAA